MTASSFPTVAVIGGGFSGLMTALHLARAGTVRVRLIEKGQHIARGAAYCTANPDHLLNVRAGNMSAWPDQPDHFAQWLAQRRPDAGAFASRGEYGRYLQGLLTEAADRPETQDRLTLVADEAVGLRREVKGWRLAYAKGSSEFFDAVVLAVGNPPPAQPAGLAQDVARGGRYFGDPWSLDDQAGRPDHTPTLLIGSGLTMVDVALSLARQAPGAPMITLSRRGLLPLAHATTSPIDADPPPVGASSTQLLTWLKTRARRHGWREAIDALRPHTQTVWRGWSDADRSRFLRHARPYWDIHRHRLAPDVAGRLASLIEDGVLTALTGRMEALTRTSGGLSLRWRPRGSRQAEILAIGQVINCTGPAGAPQDALLDAMGAAELTRPDRQQLGLDVDADGRLIGRDGSPQPRLFAVGPITRGAFWEITAVPDIRQQAALVAASVIEAVGPTPR